MIRGGEEVVNSEWETEAQRQGYRVGGRDVEEPGWGSEECSENDSGAGGTDLQKEKSKSSVLRNKSSHKFAQRG